MNIIIMGCGRVGSSMASRLDNENHSVTIMDLDSNSFRRLPENFKGTALVGSGTDQSALERAGANNANIFIALTQGDNRNLTAVQIAKHIYGIPRVISRVYDHNRASIFENLGIETFSSTGIVSNMMHDIIAEK